MWYRPVVAKLFAALLLLLLFLLLGNKVLSFVFLSVSQFTDLLRFAGQGMSGTWVEQSATACGAVAGAS